MNLSTSVCVILRSVNQSFSRFKTHVLFFAAALGLVACGGGGSSSGGMAVEPPAPLVKYRGQFQVVNLRGSIDMDVQGDVATVDFAGIPCFLGVYEGIEVNRNDGRISIGAFLDSEPPNANGSRAQFIAGFPEEGGEGQMTITSECGTGALGSLTVQRL